VRATKGHSICRVSGLSLARSVFGHVETKSIYLVLDWTCALGHRVIPVQNDARPIQLMSFCLSELTGFSKARPAKEMHVGVPVAMATFSRATSSSCPWRTTMPLAECWGCKKRLWPRWRHAAPALLVPQRRHDYFFVDCADASASLATMTTVERRRVAAPTDATALKRGRDVIAKFRPVSRRDGVLGT
jgi:hypothetical protein